ncbi:MAG: HAD family hydrolase [Gammaproteobacteria bacterium]|nr:HAD family hydrolase [Gammaproteobacteria bacterium]
MLSQESKPVNILFDLDGTLTDSRPGIVACLEHTLSELKLSSSPDTPLENFIGASLREVFKALLPAHSNKNDIEVAVSIYRERFRTKGLYENSVYEGIPEMLSSLTEQGRKLYIATSKPQVYAEKIIQHFGLAEFFQAIYGAELDGRFDLKSDLIAHVLDDSALDKELTIMIGDRYHDINGARDNHIYPVGVLWGYGSEEELCTAGAKVLCNKPRDITTLSI